MAMKNFYAKIALLTMTLLFAASHAHAAAVGPVLTLKDSERGTTAGLYPVGDKKDKGLLLYINERFNYSVKVPHEVLTQVVVLPDNADGIILQSKDGQYRFRASGGFVMSDDMFETSLKNAKEYVEKNAEGARVFEKKGDGWWALSWWNGPDKGGRRFMTNGEMWCDIEITWPGRPHNAPGAYDDLLERALESLAFTGTSITQATDKASNDKALAAMEAYKAVLQNK
ncbi:MAG: hypothetical protein FWG59_03775, partial [Betaproteobacteria bacterium]|nr:hypothetical protein [Betaproteobacteria bacterium]